MYIPSGQSRGKEGKIDDAICKALADPKVNLYKYSLGGRTQEQLTSYFIALHMFLVSFGAVRPANPSNLSYTSFCFRTIAFRTFGGGWCCVVHNSRGRHYKERAYVTKNIYHVVLDSCVSTRSSASEDSIVNRNVTCGCNAPTLDLTSRPPPPI